MIGWRRAMAGLRLALLALVTFGAGSGADAQGIDPRTLFAPSASEAASGSASADEAERPAPSYREAEAPGAEAYDRFAAGSEAPSSLGMIDDGVSVFRARLRRLAAQVPEVPGALGAAVAEASPGGHPSQFLGVAVFAALLLVLGRAVSELFLAFVARPVVVRLQRPEPRGYRDKLPVLALRFGLTAASVALTLVVATSAGVAFHAGDKPTLATVIAVFASYGTILLGHTFWRMALAPYLADYRLPALDDRAARTLYHWLAAATVVAVLAVAFSRWTRAIGAEGEVVAIVALAATLAATAVSGLALWVCRRAITRALLGGRTPEAGVSWLAWAVAFGWGPLALAALALTWGDLAVRLVMGVPAGPERIMAPFAVLALAMVVYAAVVYAVERLVVGRRRRVVLGEPLAEPDPEVGRRIDGDGEPDADAEEEAGGPVPRPAPEPGRATRMTSFEDLGRRVASLLAIGAGLRLAFWLWGGEAVFTDAMLSGALWDAIEIAFVGYVLFHAARIWLDRRIAEEGAEDDASGAILEGEGGGAGQSRLATLLPLVRNFVLGVIGVSVALLLAVEIGVNVAPLFAGAGIVGLAIGFGAQTLVRDVISGAFFLIDDAFRKGEYIDVGSVKGTVERISVRSFQLRHHLGMLHTIPFGEVQFLTNFSRDWVMMKLPLRLTYDTDVERVRKLIKKLGQRLIEDPEVGHLFLQPLKSQGVIQMEDSAMIVRVKFMTRPGDQWVTRKRVYAEIRELFDREGIRFAHREVTVRMPDLSEGRAPTEAERHALGAASRANLDVIEAEALRPTGTAGDDR
ncbi:MAG: mechanosensitive ion channel family protein [Paracoccaceae bacterium]